MAFKHKFTYEEKVKIVSEYIDGTYGFREICKRYDINQGSLKDWKGFSVDLNHMLIPW